MSDFVGWEKYAPKNKLISDIFYALLADLPFCDDCRNDFTEAWELLEKRIDKYYNLKNKTSKKAGG